MSQKSLLRIMPFVLGALIVVLVIVLIATSGDDEKDKDDTAINMADALKGDKDKKKADKKDDEIKVVDKTDVDKNVQDEKIPEDEGIIDAEKTDIPDEITPEPVDEKGAGNEFGLEFTGKADFVETKAGVNLRAGASTDTDIVVYLENSKKLERTGYNDQWTRVIYDGVECYISTPLVAKVLDSPDADGTEETGTENTEKTSGEGEEFGITFDEKNDFVELKAGINLRVGASTDTDVAEYLEKATRVERIGYNADWTKIKYNGKTCYVATFLVVKTVDSLEMPEAEETPEAETAETGDAEADNGNGDADTEAEAETEAEATTEAETENNDNEEAEEPVVVGANTTGSGSAKKLVCIDSGHQNKGNNGTEPDGPGSNTMKAKVSSGTCGNYTHINEYELNMKVSLALKAELEKRGYTVIMTHTTNDVDISNVERAQIANDANVDAFIRIHANSSSDTSVKGIETICQTKNNKYNADIYDECKKLSTCVLDSMVSATGAKKRSVWETDTMTGINWCEVPVTIVEMGFMSNKEEDELLATAEYQKKIVNGIANGIDDYFGK